LGDARTRQLWGNRFGEYSKPPFPIVADVHRDPDIRSRQGEDRLIASAFRTGYAGAPAFPVQWHQDVIKRPLILVMPYDDVIKSGLTLLAAQIDGGLKWAFP
jgi:hypothetical protein